jgi:hypothetical protein
MLKKLLGQREEEKHIKEEGEEIVFAPSHLQGFSCAEK